MQLKFCDRGTIHCCLPTEVKEYENAGDESLGLRVHLILVLNALLLAAGCNTIGPGTITRNRIEYSSSVGDSWKRQLLLNIVKLRYVDPPSFVDVGQIVAGYSLETGVSADGQIAEKNAGDRFVAIGGHTVFTDRPTITYTPLTGNRYLKSLMVPLMPDSVFFMIESGWPADAVLFAMLRAINGLKNQESTIDGTTPADPEFLRVLEIMRKIQRSGGVALRIQRDVQNQQTTLLTFRRRDISPEMTGESMELRRLLRLDPEATEFKLVFGAAAANDKEIAVLTRSVLNLMQTMASQVEVPAQHLAEHRTPSGWESSAGIQNNMRLITIHCSTSSPVDAYVAVTYRDYWFWIDDCDLKSKRAFAFVMMTFTLADTGEKEPLPLITIPAQ
jgi:hypothetical protein